MDYYEEVAQWYIDSIESFTKEEVKKAMVLAMKEANRDTRHEVHAAITKLLSDVSNMTLIENTDEMENKV